MNWEIRRTSPEEWRDYRDLRLRSLQDAPTAFGSTYEREAAFAEDDWRKRLANGMSFLAYPDEMSGPVGIVGGFGWRPQVTLLVAMWIDPAYRGTGLGRPLIDAVVDGARGAGSNQVMLHVTETNVTARKLYERYGFAYTGEREPLDSHPSLDSLLMALPIGP